MKSLWRLQRKHVSCFRPIDCHCRKTGSLVLIALPLLTVSRIQANLLVVLLQGSHVLASFGELSLLHAFADVPVDKRALGVHQIELVVQPGSLEISLELKFLTIKKSHLAQASAIAVVLESMQTARCTLAKSPPGITVGGW